MIEGTFYNEADQYDSFSNLFKAVVNKDSPMNQKKVWGNNASFIIKELRKYCIKYRNFI